MLLARSTTDSRGEATRSRILDAAITVFAETGYEGASTRHLAAAAGVNQPAIQYHFSSKEGLFAAVVEQIAQDLTARLGDANAAIAAALAHNAPFETLQAALFQMLDAFADMALDHQSHETQGLFIARAELENSEMLAPLGAVIAQQIIGPCAQIIGRITGREGSDESVLRAIAIVGQIVNFKNKCLGATIRTCLGLDGFGDAMKTQVKGLIREHTAAILAYAKENKCS
jgi:AcrR family transcriptional regulator